MRNASGPISLPATLSVSPADLARLGAGPVQTEVVALLKDVKAMLADLRERIADNRLAVDGDEAARMLGGISRKTLQGLPIPSVSTGGRRMWPVENLRRYIQENAAVYVPVTAEVAQ